jgi:hypothetical protein
MVLPEARQNLGHLLRREGDVVDLRPEHQKRLAVDQQRVSCAMRDQLRQRTRLCRRQRTGC